MSRWPKGMQIGSFGNTLNSYVPVLSMILLNPTPLDARFSKTKFSTVELMKRPVAPITGSKILILYFS